MSHNSRLLPGLRPRAASCVASLCVAASIALAGCAQQTSRHAASHVTGPEPARTHRTSMPVGTPSRPRKVEADGLPVQTAPYRKSVSIDDDPREPFSPNYGSVPLNPGQPEPHDPQAEPDLTPTAPSYEVRRSPLPPPPKPKGGVNDKDAAKIIARAQRAHGWKIW